jgi:hypothetical protein
VAAGNVNEVSKEIGGSCFHVTIPPESYDQIGDVIDELSVIFPKAIINNIGATISITAKDLDAKLISHTLENLSFSSLHINEVVPGLEDSMSYFLRTLQTESFAQSSSEDNEGMSPAIVALTN